MYYKINPTGCTETMREITDITLIDRTTRLVSYADGKKEYHCRGPQNTIAYFDGSGVLRDQDVNFGAETYSKSVSGLWLRNKNSTSVGVRLDGILTKYLGMRPDNCQDGSVQLEFSIENIKINDINQSVSLAKSALTMDEKKPIDSYSDMIRVFPYRQGCRQLVKAASAVRGFVITYRIHATGLELVSNDLGEFWFADKAGVVKFRIRKPVLCDINTLEPIFLDPLQMESTSKLLTHSLKLQADGTYLYTKESVADLSLHKLPPEFYVDADTVYSTTADGRVYSANAVWATSHDASTGAGVNSSNASYNYAFGFTFDSVNYQFYRSFFYYDLSALSGTVESAIFYFYASSASYLGSHICIQGGIQYDTLRTDDFDSFWGNYWGSANLSSSNYVGITANSEGITEVSEKLGSTLKVAGRDYTYDYLNSSYQSSTATSVYYSDATGTSYDPYVSLTFGSGEAGHPARKRHAGNPFTPFRKGVW